LPPTSSFDGADMLVLLGKRAQLRTRNRAGDSACPNDKAKQSCQTTERFVNPGDPHKTRHLKLPVHLATPLLFRVQKQFDV
jgi:hypothetical protein